MVARGYDGCNRIYSGTVYMTHTHASAEGDMFSFVCISTPHVRCHVFLALQKYWYFLNFFGEPISPLQFKSRDTADSKWQSPKNQHKE